RPFHVLDYGNDRADFYIGILGRTLVAQHFAFEMRIGKISGIDIEMRKKRSTDYAVFLQPFEVLFILEYELVQGHICRLNLMCARTTSAENTSPVLSSPLAIPS